MSEFLVALLVSGVFGYWMYLKFIRRTGGANAKNAVVATLAVAFAAFIILYTLLLTIVPD